MHRKKRTAERPTRNALHAFASIGCEDGQLLGCHCIGSGATELIHVGQAVLALGGGLDYFLTTVFNYPTPAECYKVAAHNAANKLALVRQATASSAGQGMAVAQTA